MKRLLVVDDELNVTRSIARVLNNQSYEVITSNHPLEALQLAERESFNAVLSDQRMPDISGYELLTEMSKLQPGCTRLAMSAHQDFESMVQMFNTGLIEHFIPKPWNNKNIRELLGAHLRSTQTDEIAEMYDQFVTNDPAMKSLFHKMSQLVDHTVPIFVYGETGTGKELVARALHEQAGLSGRFVAVNCSNFSSDLLESQLFGHKKGAFTGAIADQEGLLQAAEGGTLFLDEITDLPATVQNKLLRVLQERVYTPLGCTKEVHFDCRLVSAASTRLHDAVQSGSFRADLMYRLEVIPIDLPPLRARREDAQLLFAHFTDPTTFSEEVAHILNTYEWPGNVRELQNAAMHALAFAGEGEPIDVHHLPARFQKINVQPDCAANLSSNTQTEISRESIELALRRHGNNRSATARELGISRMTLYRYLK
jgi:DNA-binding NtrC family response regulator